MELLDIRETSVARRYKEKIGDRYRDSLTCIHNHGIFDQFLNWELKKSQRRPTPLALCMVDLDGFGLFNRHYGSIEGDIMLRETARVITENSRESDLVARYAGDRFAMLLVDLTPAHAEKVAERIRKAIEKMSGGRLTVSIGISVIATSTPLDRDDKIRECEYALKEAKRQGKNRTILYRETVRVASQQHSRILVVDDEPLNLKVLEALLMPLGYYVTKAGSGPEALEALEKMEIDLVLLDVMMPGMNGHEVCRRIKSNEETRMIPVILLTALDASEHKINGIESGADDFLTKPPRKDELLARIRSLLKMNNLNRNLASIENVLFSMANTVEAKDTYTQGHVVRVAELAMTIGRRMDRPTQELHALRIGGHLHDIGKIGVPGAVLNKPGPLSDTEWALMKKHPEIGHNICLPLKKNLKDALDVIRHHHEKLDGSGYPDGFSGEEISIPARILSVADIYDALTTDRAYRKAMPQKKALTILKEEGCQGKLDRGVVDCLREIILSRKA